MPYTYTFGDGNGNRVTLEGQSEQELKANYVNWLTSNNRDRAGETLGGTAPVMTDDEYKVISAYNRKVLSPQEVKIAQQMGLSDPMSRLHAETPPQAVKDAFGDQAAAQHQSKFQASVQAGLGVSPYEGGKMTSSSGQPITGGQLSQPSALSAPSASGLTPSTIGNPVDVSSGTGALPAPTFSTPTGTSTAATYQTGLAQNVDNAKAALLAEADRRAAEYQKQIDALEQKDRELQQLQDAGMMGLKDTYFASAAEKRAALDLEKARFDENYNASQALIGELDTLLTQGNAAIENLKGTTGLSSIMNPRIAQTMSDVAARAGVIQAILSARSNQMSQAQSQLGTTVNALESIYGDQIAYYKDLVNYYGGLKDENNNKIINLDRTQKEYLDVKINLLGQELDTIRATAKYVEQQMLDPDRALAFAKAGVTLKDSVETINQKLANYAYSQEVANISNTMSQKGYSTTPIAGVQPVVITDSNGVARSYYREPEAAAAANGESGQFTLGTNQIRFDANGNVIAEGPKPVEKTTQSEMDELLSPSEAKALGVPYGTTKGQAAQTAPKPAPSGYPMVQLAPGASDKAAVTQLQQYLVAQGYMSQADMDTGPGIYGPKTTAAVLKMQQALGIDYSSAPGTYGPRTIAALQGKVYVAPKSTTPKTTEFGSLSKGDQTKAVNWVLTNGGTDADVEKLKTDRAFQAWVLSQLNADDGREL